MPCTDRLRRNATSGISLVSPYATGWAFRDDDALVALNERGWLKSEHTSFSPMRLVISSVAKWEYTRCSHDVYANLNDRGYALLARFQMDSHAQLTLRGKWLYQTERNSAEMARLLLVQPRILFEVARSDDSELENSSLIFAQFCTLFECFFL
jgi:hypothetical protein